MISQGSDRLSPAYLPVVSIVIATHDFERYLGAAIASVRAQSFSKWECIVVDDGSTDGTSRLLEEIAAREPRVRVLRQGRSGVSAARNAGLAAAQGEYVQFLDADDMLHPMKLARQVDILGASPSVDIVHGPVAYFPDPAGPPSSDGSRHGAVMNDRAAWLSGPGTALVGRLIPGNVLTVCAPLVRRSLLESVGGFDRELRHLEDWDLWLRCAARDATFLHVPSDEPLVWIRQHRTSLSADLRAMLSAEVPVRRRLSELLTFPEDRTANEVSMAVAAGKESALEGRASEAIRRLLPVALRRRAWRLLPWLVVALLSPIPGFRHLVDVAMAARARRPRREWTARRGRAPR